MLGAVFWLSMPPNRFLAVSLPVSPWQESFEWLSYIVFHVLSGTDFSVEKRGLEVRRGRARCKAGLTSYSGKGLDTRGYNLIFAYNTMTS